MTRGAAARKSVFLGGRSHEGKRDDCPSPGYCEYPHTGGLVTARDERVERAGELVDFHIIRTSPEDEYVIASSTIRQPDWGMYCRHGLKVIEAVPIEHTCGRPAADRPGVFDIAAIELGSSGCPACYPEGRKVEPWPCQEDGCTEADFDRAQEQEIEEYWEGINDLMRTQYD